MLITLAHGVIPNVPARPSLKLTTSTSILTWERSPLIRVLRQSNSIKTHLKILGHAFQSSSAGIFLCQAFF